MAEVHIMCVTVIVMEINLVTKRKCFVTAQGT